MKIVDNKYFFTIRMEIKINRTNILGFIDVKHDISIRNVYTNISPIIFSQSAI